MERVEIDSIEINNQFFELIKYQLKFYYPQINNIELHENKLIITLENQIGSEELISEINRLKDKYSSIKMNKKSKVLYSSRTNKFELIKTNLNLTRFLENTKLFVQKIRDVECNFNLTAKQNKGLNIYSGLGVLIKDEIDKLLESYFMNTYGAINITVPSIISTDILEKTKYFETGCQHLSFISQLNTHPVEFKQVMSLLGKDDSNKFENLKDYFKKSEYALNPAICLHCYPLFKEHYETTDIKAFTVSGSCFRNESGNLNNAERLYEFSVREAVFLGDDTRQKIVHNELIDFFVILGYVLGLDYKLETANDIFFNENADKLLMSQLISDNKIELLCFSSKLKKYIAIGSINKHQNHFTKAFDIKNKNGQYYNTMCIAVGLNRLMLVVDELIENDLDAFLENVIARVDVFTNHLQERGEIK
ncbi:aminoacyl--tRNA ligase-related protein [Bacillus cereus group sp. BfR-BA-01441]|uniref:aminoacyl--tRNA ligase-related protein n=1 Tax=Bacillus cereus group sp. BfR-BA-01441 TaxID=2920348 RepID=UPI001F580355